MKIIIFNTTGTATLLKQPANSALTTERYLNDVTRGRLAYRLLWISLDVDIWFCLSCFDRASVPSTHLRHQFTFHSLLIASSSSSSSSSSCVWLPSFSISSIVNLAYNSSALHTATSPLLYGMGSARFTGLSLYFYRSSPGLKYPVFPLTLLYHYHLESWRCLSTMPLRTSIPDCLCLFG